MRTRRLVAMGTTMVGIVWIAQGAGFLRGSGFMDGDARWALAGAVLVAIGVVTAFSAWRGRRSS